VDIDANARQLARAELLLAGIPNCSLRKGDMYRLPFADQEFNTIIIDDVLADARDPVRALEEARRLLRPGGRLFVLESVLKRPAADIQNSLASWSKTAGLRLAPARFAPKKNPAWLVSVATAIGSRTEAA
jgi:ArsR family transcriptional regulator